MKTMALVVSALVLSSAAHAASGLDQSEARRLLETMRTAERMVAASISTRDTPEMVRQADVLTAAVDSSERRASGSDRFDSCLRSAIELAGLSRYFDMVGSVGLDARRLEGLRAVYGRWRAEMAACEKALGDRQQRSLVLDLNQ